MNEEEDVKTEVRYRTSLTGAVPQRQPQGGATSYIILLSGVILGLLLVVAALCLYNRYSLTRRALIKEAIHTQHPGEIGAGPRGFALEEQYNPRDVERSVEFIADCSKRAAPSRNDTVSKMMATVDAVDGEQYLAEDESLPGFGLIGDKVRDADATGYGVYDTGASMLDNSTSPATAASPASPGEAASDQGLFKELTTKKRKAQKAKKPSVVPEVAEDSQDGGSLPSLPDAATDPVKATREEGVFDDI